MEIRNGCLKNFFVVVGYVLSFHPASYNRVEHVYMEIMRSCVGYKKR